MVEFLSKPLSNYDVFWSVTPDRAQSPYIRDIAASIEAAGWRISPLTLRAIATTQRRVVHVQWPEHVARGKSTVASLAKQVRAVALLGAISARKHVVVLTAHNRKPHYGNEAFDGWFRRALQKRAVATIVLVDEHESELRSAGMIRASTIVRSIPHPVLPIETHSERAPQEQRNGLVLLGKIHPYHQLAELVAALEHGGNTRPVLIAGVVGDDDLLASLTQSAARLSWLTIRPGFQTDETLAPALADCAAFVSLQQNPFNSGAPYHALGLNLPVVVSCGAQADHLARNAGDDWVFAVPEDVSKLDVAQLDAWLKRERSSPQLEAFDATMVAAQHIELYELVLSKNG